MMQNAGVLRWGAVLLVAVGLVGCARKRPAPVSLYPQTPPPRQTNPSDFVTPPAVDGTSSAAPVAAASAAPSASPSAGAGEATPTGPLSASSNYMVEAMVGHVNGKPLYAYQVFAPMHEQLSAMGNRLNRGEFRQQAGVLIAQRLRQEITDALILGEAESQLSPQQRFGLLQYLKERREELVRKLGQGSVLLTEGELRETSGITLEQQMKETRQQVLVQNFLRSKLLPKINVTRKDIERFYDDNNARFNPPSGRTINLIQTRKRTVAEQIEQQLAQGVPFLELAGDKNFNDYKPEEQGLFGKGLPGDEPFGAAPLNEALVKLGQGQHSPRLTMGERYLWIYVQTISTGKGKTLAQAQLEIEQELRRRQFHRLTEQYQQKLFDEGSYHPVDEMLRSLVDIAMNVYSPVS